jgi:signal peptidase I
MRGGRLFGAVLLTLLFPGFGQGLAFRRYRMLGFALGAIVTTLAILWSVWFLPITLALRVASAVDAFVLLRSHTTPGHRVLAAIALVTGAVVGGSYKVALEVFKIPSSSMYPTLEIGDHIYVDKLSLRWRPPERGEIIVFTQPCAQVPYIKRVIALAGDTVEVRCNVVYVNGTPLAREVVTPDTSYDDYDEYNREWRTRSASRYREKHGGHAYETFQNRDEENAPGHDFPPRDKMIAPSCHSQDFYPEKPGVAEQPLGLLVVTKPDAQPCDVQAHYVVPPHSLFVMGDNRNNANDSRYWGAVSVDAVIGRVIGVWMNSPPGRDRQWSRFGAIE